LLCKSKNYLGNENAPAEKNNIADQNPQIVEQIKNIMQRGT
jgi:hypothetical protein